jgi:hypothetical protein
MAQPRWLGMLQSGIRENFVELSLMGTLQSGIRAQLSKLSLHGPFNRVQK